MSSKRVRRLPIVEREGALVGLVSVDDLVELLANELSVLSCLVGTEESREIRTHRRHHPDLPAPSNPRRAMSTRAAGRGGAARGLRAMRRR